MIRFALGHPGIATVPVGTKDPAPLVTNVAAAARGPLPADVHEEAKRRLDKAGITGDEAPRGQEPVHAIGDAPEVGFAGLVP